MPPLLPPGAPSFGRTPELSLCKPTAPSYSGKASDEGTGNGLTSLFVFIVFNLIFIESKVIHMHRGENQVVYFGESVGSHSCCRLGGLPQRGLSRTSPWLSPL